MPTKSNMINENVFNYTAFHKDILTKAKENGTTLAEISTKRLFKSECYLSNGLMKHKLPLPIAMAVAEWFGLNLRDYKIEKPKPVPKPEPKKEPAPSISSMEQNGWTCEIKVDEEFGTVMMKVARNGERVAIGRSYLYGTDMVGVLQSISYAAHMCYKLTQQDAIEEIQKPVERVLFKDWITKYENTNSTYGSFARYVKSHYKNFPSSGEKDMRFYLRLNNGEAHMAAFTTLFKMYLGWYKEARDMKMPPAATDGKIR